MIKLRKLDKKDFKLLEKWCKQKEIYTSFEQRILTYEEIVKKYEPRIKEDTKIPTFMILYNDNPIGIIQYQIVSDENKKAYGISGDNSYDVDIYIGEINLHNKGIGTESINILTDMLFNEMKAEKIVLCTLSNNYQAIKCYQKCGYEIKKEIEQENTIGEMHKYLVMIKEH